MSRPLAAPAISAAAGCSAAQAVRARSASPRTTAVRSIVADYRASAGIDIEHDLADRAAGHTLAMPVSVVQ